MVFVMMKNMILGTGSFGTRSVVNDEYIIMVSTVVSTASRLVTHALFSFCLLRGNGWFGYGDGLILLLFAILYI